MKMSKEIKIALVAIAGILVMYFGINFLKGKNLFSSNNFYYITFDNIEGLGASSPIYANGYKVGTVEEVHFDFDESGPIKLKVEINKELRIPKESTAEIVKDLMGNLQVHLTLAKNSGEYIEPGGAIKGIATQGLMDKVSSMVPTIELMLPKMDSILTNLNALVSDPAIAASLHNIQTITSDLTVSTRELNTLMTGLNRDVPGLMKRANGVLDNTGKLTSNLAALDVQGTLDKVNATLENAQAFTDKLNSNEGTLGKLMTDPGLYNNLNSTMRDADSLLVNLKQHPGRYVHFSLFGKKDK